MIHWYRPKPMTGSRDGGSARYGSLSSMTVNKPGEPLKPAETASLPVTHSGESVKSLGGREVSADQATLRVRREKLVGSCCLPATL